MLVHHRRRSRYSRDRVLCVGASQLRAATISQGHMARGRSDDAAGAVRGAFRRRERPAALRGIGRDSQGREET